MGKSSHYKVTIIAPTCFYYQAPLFRELSSDSRLDLTLYFCSDEGVSGKDVRTVYGADQNWGEEVDILEGYKSKFLQNHAPWGSYLKSLIGLANFGVWKELDRERPDVVVIMSWMNPTWWLTFLACLRFKIPMFFMTDANFDAEQFKSRWRTSIKRLLLGRFLFPATSGFLCAGSTNRRFYTGYGVPEEKLIPFAYSRGFSQLIEHSKQYLGQKSELREEYGIPQDATVILYVGRLSSEKGSIELLEAYKMVSHPKKALVLVGNGHLRGQMQQMAQQDNLDSIYFMGFQNRIDIGKFYTLADFLVLPSQRETWGLVVNEALCFSLPVIVSDQVGAGQDLVIPEENGYIFPVGDVPALARSISNLCEIPDEDRRVMGEKSLTLIKKWSSQELATPLIEYLDSIYHDHG